LRFTSCDQILGLISHASTLRREGNLPLAERVLASAIRLAPSLPEEYGRNYHMLAIGQLALVRERQGRADDAAKARATFISLLDAGQPALEPELFHVMMTTLLEDMSEFRRAIPWFEPAIAALVATNEPLDVARTLQRMGHCYNRRGLRDQAVVPLRAALAILRQYPGDPRLGSVLMSLGIALTGSAPVEAERLLQETADLFFARGQLESATTPWINLGVLCSRNGRYQEALAWYRRALEIRDKSPGTAPEALGLLLNNMAYTHCHLREFPAALALAERAIAILEPTGGERFASACGTMGQILHDQGRDTDALAWLLRSRSVRESLPSPNLASLCEILESEADSFERLGRAEEAAAARERLAAARAEQAQAGPGEIDTSGLTAQPRPVVQIEIPIGLRDPVRKADRASLAQRLTDAGIAAQGEYGGYVSVPESTTYFFYAPDAEDLYATLEPVLLAEPLCAGSHVLIRQDQRLREVSLPGMVM
jgi:tetratricopeptide (TPR) repeat protein